MKYNKHYNPHHIDRLMALQGMPLASFWRRALAFFIDFCISSIMLIAGMVAYAFTHLTSNKRTFVFGVGPNGSETWNLVAEFLLPIVYFGLIVYFTQGKTIGKWISGIRIVSIMHDRISFMHSAERAMAYATSILEFGFGFVQFFMNVNHRTLGDKVGETIVIRDRLTKKEKETAAKSVDSEGEKDVVDLDNLIHEEAEIEPE